MRERIPRRFCCRPTVQGEVRMLCPETWPPLEQFFPTVTVESFVWPLLPLLGWNSVEFHFGARAFGIL